MKHLTLVHSRCRGVNSTHSTGLRQAPLSGSLMVPSGHSLDLALLSQGVHTGRLEMHHQSTTAESPEFNVPTDCV